MSKRKIIIVAVCCAFIAICSVAGTIAWLNADSSALINMFTPGKVSCYVEETFDGTTKSGVRIENTGNIDVYIRVKLVPTLKDASGNIYAKTPVQNTDYSLDLNTGSWFLGSDGFYYCKARIASPARDESGIISTASYTDILINSCTAFERSDGLTFDLQILAETIQADPSTTVTAAWKTVSVDQYGQLQTGGA